jgi:hypothetical protein
MRRLLCLLALAACAAPARAEEPKAVVERAVAALGGKELLSRQTAWKFTFKATLDAGPDLAMQGEMLAQPPGRQKMSAKIKIGDQELEMVQVVDGKKGWRKTGGLGAPQGIMDVSEQELASQAGYAHTERVSRLLPLLEDRGFTLTALAEEKVEGRPAVGVKAAYQGQPDVSIWFDKESGLPVKAGYRNSPAPGLPEGLAEMLYGDYRDPDNGAAEEKALAAAGVKADAEAVRAFLKKQVPDADAVKKARDLVKKLAADDFDVREKAAAEVVTLGKAAVPALEAATLDDDLEVARRAKACLEQIKTRMGIPTTLAAVRWLGLKTPAGAAEALLELADGADASVTAEIKAALLLLAQRPGGPPAALKAALTDKSPARRAVAAAALGADGEAYLKSPRRLYLPGLKQPMKLTMFRDGKKEAVLELSELHYYNRFDDKEFERPRE